MLKMLGLYLDTLIIGHIFSSTLTLQNRLQTFITNNVFWILKPPEHNLGIKNGKISKVSPKI